MGKISPTRIALAAGTMGLSEQLRAGMNLAKGSNPVDAVANAATFGASDAVGVTGKAAADGLPNLAGAAMGAFPDAAKAAAAAAVNADEEDALTRVKRRAATLLTGGLGVSDAAPVARKTLLGS